MIGVKFTKDMRPYGRGDVALLPPEVARRIIEEGSAERHAFPAAPHAAEAGAASRREEPRPVLTPPKRDDRRQNYQTKDVRK